MHASCSPAPLLRPSLFSLLQKARSATADEERAKQDLSEAEAKLKELENLVKETAEKAAAAKQDDGMGFEGLDPPNMNVQQLQVRGVDAQVGMSPGPAGSPATALQLRASLPAVVPCAAALACITLQSLLQCFCNAMFYLERATLC